MEGGRVEKANDWAKEVGKVAEKAKKMGEKAVYEVGKVVGKVKKGVEGKTGCTVLGGGEGWKSGRLGEEKSKR